MSTWIIVFQDIEKLFWMRFKMWIYYYSVLSGEIDEHLMNVFGAETNSKQTESISVLLLSQPKRKFDASDVAAWCGLVLEEISN